MTPDLDNLNLIIDGNVIYYRGTDGVRHETTATGAFDAIRAWEQVTDAWVNRQWPEMNRRHNAITERLEVAGWICQSAGAGTVDCLPADWQENEGGPIICVPYVVTADWAEKMAACERRADEWFADHNLLDGVPGPFAGDSYAPPACPTASPLQPCSP